MTIVPWGSLPAIQVVNKGALARKSVQKGAKKTMRVNSHLLVDDHLWSNFGFLERARDHFQKIAFPTQEVVFRPAAKPPESKHIMTPNTMTPTMMVAPSGVELAFWTSEQLHEAWSKTQDLKVLADGCRLNALSAIQAAGSGHIGTSFSSLDIMV